MTLRRLPSALIALAALGASAAGQDFDLANGTFRSYVRRLQKPLTGSTAWIEAEGEVRTRKVLNGLGQLEQIELNQPSGPVHAISLRLWNPATKQWSLYSANARRGIIGTPSVGEFKDGRGEFYDQEEWDGKIILVREVFSGFTAGSYHFEQSFSADGGRTWETNWIADCKRVDSLPALPEAKDRNHDFDFNLGKWRTHLSRFSAGKWVDFDGTAEVTPLLGGRANLIELSAGPMEGIGIRLYNPEGRAWSLNWVTAKRMTLETPTVGSFGGGRGEFVDVEPLDGRMGFVRETFVPPSKFEQAFSFDAGSTWQQTMKISFEPLPRDG